MQSFSFFPHMASEKKIFECVFFFRKFSLSVAMVTNQNQRFGQNSYGRGLLQKHFSKTFVKISAVTQK